MRAQALQQFAPHGEQPAARRPLLQAPGGTFITGQNLIVDGGTSIGDGN